MLQTASPARLQNAAGPQSLRRTALRRRIGRAAGTRRDGVHFALDGIGDLAGSYRRGGMPPSHHRQTDDNRFRRIIDTKSLRDQTVFTVAGNRIDLMTVLKRIEAGL